MMPKAIRTGKTDKGPRDKFLYIGHGAEVMAVRIGDWKMVFMEQRASYFDIWREPFVTFRSDGCGDFV